MIDAQDKMLQDAMATLDAAAPAPREVAPVSTRRTRIVADLPAQAPGTYRIVTDYGQVVDTEAPGYGEAVLAAIKSMGDAGTPIGAYVFMWQYAVTGPDGVTLRGKTLQRYLDAARIDASNRNR